MTMRYSVIGTGGIGAYYGARLVQSGHDVEFLFRSDFDHVTSHGLRVDSCRGNIFLPQVKAFKSSEDMSASDVVLVCTKTTSNEALPSLLMPILRPGTAIVMIQNGLGMEEELAARLSEYGAPQGVHIIGATAFICSSRIAPGHIDHTGYGELTLASAESQSPESSAYAEVQRLLTAIQADFEASFVPCHLCDSLPLMRWKKLVWNIPYNGLSVVKNLRTDELTMGENRNMVRSMMLEVIEAARACGTLIDESFADAMIASTENMAPYFPSMYLDYKAGRKMETGTMYGNPISTARANGFEMKLAKSVMDELNQI